jgi:hypothetical protein
MTRPHLLEAKCRKCGETFNPADAQDTIHMIREDGSFCGGTGDIQGHYTSPNPANFSSWSPEPWELQ